MDNWLKLSHRHHSGRLRPHEHTSYALLAVLLFIVGISLTAYSVKAGNLTWTRPGPAAGSIGITGTMPGKPPTQGAVITAPSNGQHFTTSPVLIKGTCPANTLVEIFKNDIFAGSTVCTDKGAFEIDIDLIIGQNAIVAKVYDALNQAGPDSPTVTIAYDASLPNASGQRSLDFGGDQMLVLTDAVFRGNFPGQEMTIPVRIVGGTAPYAVNVEWGDLKNNLISRGDSIEFRTPHTYAKAGIYQLGVQATDTNGRVAFLTVAAIINGQVDPVATTTTATASTQSKLLALWPLYTAAVAMVISFWLGEKREKHDLAAHGQLLTP